MGNFVKSAVLLLSIPLLGWASALRVAAALGARCRGIDAPSACIYLPGVRLLADASIASAVVVIALFAMIAVGARIAAGSPQRLAAIFGLQIRLTLIVVAGVVVVQGAILTYSVFIVGVVVFHLIYIYALASLAFGTVGACGAILWSLATMDLHPAGSALAIPVSRTEQPRLWDLIDRLAIQTGATVPGNLLIGLSTAFYVSSGKIRFTGTRQGVGGDTLYLSAPALRLVSEDELAAIVAHELAHFRASDTIYTRRFLPIYRGLEGALRRLTTGWSLWNLACLPAISVLGFAYDQFSSAERSISREREFAADRVAADAVAQEPVISALIKLGWMSRAWPDMQALAESLLNQDRALENISATFEDHAHHVLAETPPDLLLEQVLALHQPHPIDTHPTLAARAAALGVKLDDAATLMRREGAPASALIEGLAEIEIKLTRHTHRLMADGLRPANA